MAVLLIAAMRVCLPSQAQEKISLPEGTVEGWLPNGLHYIVKQNDTPASRVEFRLMMRVGSVQETGREAGCAHFLEHLAFGGTRHFPGRSAVDYLESKGVKYGIGINAFTGYDRTIYMFGIPSGDKAAIDTSLLIIRDWMDGISIHPEDVEDEKGIILEELRGYDVGDDFYSLKIGGGRYGRGIPLGTEVDIMSVTPKTLRRFYRKWYVPSLATVVVVGDIDPARTEARIREMFSSIKGRRANNFRTYQLEYPHGVQLMEVRDSLRSRTRIELMMPHPCVTVKTLEDAVSQETGRLLVQAVSARLRGRRMRVDVSDQWYLADKNHFVVSVEGKDREEVLGAVSSVSAELTDMACNGWEDEELADVKKGFTGGLPDGIDLSGYPSSALCEDFTDYVVAGDRHVFSQEECRQLKEAVGAVRSADLQKMLLGWLSCGDRTMLVACSSHPGLGGSLTGDEVKEAWSSGVTRECEPYAYAREESVHEPDVQIPEYLAERHAYDSAAVAEVREYGGIGVREVLLRNGIRLVLKPTGDADSTVYFSSFSPLAGLSENELSLTEYLAYMDMTGTAASEGDEGALSEYMYRHGMGLTMALENHWCGYMGMFRAEDAAEMFNLIYSKITAPGIPDEDFADDDGPIEESMLAKMLKRDSARQMEMRARELMGETVHHPSPAGKVQADSVAQLYMKLFGQTGGTSYVICGNFDVDSMMRTFVSVFGRMAMCGPSPAPDGSCPPAASGYQEFEFPDSVVVEGFPNGNPSQSMFDYLFYGHYDPCLRSSLTLKLMRDVLRNRLISVLRERESLVYSPYVSLFYEGLPWRKFHFDVNASADNRNMERIHLLIGGILHDLRTEEVPQKELQSLKRSFIVAKREELDGSSPSAWRTVLSGLLKNGESMADFDSYEDCLDSISPSDLRDAFREWIDNDNYVLLYMSGEKFDLR